nr:MAG TPA: chitin synthase regulator [Bacteriophage sp.]
MHLGCFLVFNLIFFFIFAINIVPDIKKRGLKQGLYKEVY